MAWPTGSTSSPATPRPTPGRDTVAHTKGVAMARRTWSWAAIRGASFALGAASGCGDSESTPDAAPRPSDARPIDAPVNVLDGPVPDAPVPDAPIADAALPDAGMTISSETGPMGYIRVY